MSSRQPFDLVAAARRSMTERGFTPDYPPQVLRNSQLSRRIRQRQIPRLKTCSMHAGVYATATCVCSSRIYPAAVWNSIPRPGAQNLRLVSSLSRPADWVQLIDFIELGSSYGSHSDANREWTPESVELYTQATLQSAFSFAKAKHNREVAAASFGPPRRYLELPFNQRSGTALQCMDRVQRYCPENPMSRNRFAAAASLVFVLGSIFGVARQTWAEDANTQYPSMASLDQYTMADRDAEIALARSAAPTSISGDATILVLEKNGYQTAVKGKNGFTCLVERSWMNPFDSPEFWNSKMRGPICYNPAAARTILPYTINRTRLALTGLSKAQIRENITAAIAKNELPIPEAGAMSYMMSNAGNLGDSVGHWRPHLMFHIPKTDDATWGANLAGSPVVFNDQYRDVPEPEMILMLPVAHWSDGTAAPHQVLD